MEWINRQKKKEKNRKRGPKVVRSHRAAVGKSKEMDNATSDFTAIAKEEKKRMGESERPPCRSLFISRSDPSLLFLEPQWANTF